MIHQFEPTLTKADANAVYRQVRSGRIGPGHKVRELERMLCFYSGRERCCAVTSGTMALFSALYALNLPADSIIYFPAYTFLAGAHAAMILGYKVVLVDIDDTLCMDPKLLLQAIKDDGYEGRRAVIYVQHNGYVGEGLKSVYNECLLRRIPLIVDAAQSFLNQSAFDDGDIVATSFSVPKAVTGGQGGAVFTNNDAYASRLREIIDHGDQEWRRSKIHSAPGLNLRMTDIQASLILNQHKRLDKIRFKVMQLFYWYNLYLPIEHDGYWRQGGMQSMFNHYPWMMVYKVPDDMAVPICDRLQIKGVNAVVYYSPIAMQEYFDAHRDDYPEAESAAGRLIYLPSSLKLRRREVKRICQELYWAERQCLGGKVD